MANFTQKAIKASFMKLLNEKPLSKISVRDIVEDCGINRNSFYYHFQDIPSLLEEIIGEETKAIIEKFPSINSVDECFNYAFSFAIKNKKAAYHIFNSVNRERFETELMKICDHTVNMYVRTVFTDDDVDEADRKIIVDFIKCEIFGLMISWLMNGMEEAAINNLLRVTSLCKGMSAEIINRIKEEKN